MRNEESTMRKPSAVIPSREAGEESRGSILRAFMRRFIPHPSSLIPSLVVLFALTASAQSLHITEKPEGLVSGRLPVPIVASNDVQRIVFFINGVKYSE